MKGLRKNFELEPLEPRVLLSADGGLGAVWGGGAASPPLPDVALNSETSLAEELWDDGGTQDGYEPAANLADIFQGMTDPPAEAREAAADPDPAALDSPANSTPVDTPATEDRLPGEGVDAAPNSNAAPKRATQAAPQSPSEPSPAVVIELNGLLRLSFTSVTYTVDPGPDDPVAMGNEGELELLQWPGFAKVTIGNVALFQDGTQIDGFEITSFQAEWVGSISSGQTRLVDFERPVLSIPRLARRHGAVSGTINLSGAGAVLFPGVSGFSARISDRGDGGASLAGSIDLDTGALTLTGEFSTFTVGTVLKLEADNAQFQFGSGLNEIARINSSRLEIPGFVRLDEAVVEGILITQDGFSIARAHLSSANPVRGPPGAMALVEVRGLSIDIENLALSFAAPGEFTGSFAVTAQSAILFPDAQGGGLAQAQSYSDPGTSETIPALRATLDTNHNLNWISGKISADIAGLFRLELIRPTLSIGPDATGPLFTTALATATVPALGNLEARLHNLQIERTGGFSLSQVELVTAGLSQRFGLAGFLPFDIHQVTLDFLGDTNRNGQKDAGETWDLNQFSLAVEGNFDFQSLASLPFNPVLRLGQLEARSAADTLSFAVKIAEGKLAPLDLGPITVGFADLAVGPVTLGGTITLGAYRNGVWANEFGGSITLGAGFEGVSGQGTVGLLGSLNLGTGVLGIAGQFNVGFNLGQWITVEGATLDFGLVLDADENFAIALRSLTFAGLSVDRVVIQFGTLMVFEANRTPERSAVTFNFDPGEGEYLAEFGALSVRFPGLAGLGGLAANFAIDRNLKLVTLPNFSVAINPPASGLFGFPDWLPLNLSEISIQFRDLANDPTNLTLTFSAAIAGGFVLPITGGVSGLEIDLQRLKRGEFPILNLERFRIGIEDLDLGGIAIDATLTLGLVPLDAQGNRLQGADRENPAKVARRVLYGLVEGGFDLMGDYGASLRFGLSEAGPLVFYAQVNVPILLEPNTGLTLSGIRGGVRFGAEFPEVKNEQDELDPLLLRGPGFKPASELTPEEWIGQLEEQVATLARGTNPGELPGLDFLSKPMLFELGGTLTSVQIPGLSANLDLILSTQGKMLLSGDIRIEFAGMDGPFTLAKTKLYLDLSQIATGNLSLLFLADLPQDSPKLTVYGTLTFGPLDRNGDGDPEAFSLIVTGGADLHVSAVDVAFSGRFAVTFSSTQMTLEVAAQFELAPLGQLQASGLMCFVYGAAGSAPKLWGAMQLSLATPDRLEKLGIRLQAGLSLQFNSTDQVRNVELTIGQPGTVVTYAIPALSFAIKADGALGVNPAGKSLCTLTGVFAFEWDAAGVRIFADATLILGEAEADPLLSFRATGYLRLNTRGLAGRLDIDLATGFPKGSGLELDARLLFIVNTTGQEVRYELPPGRALRDGSTSLTIPRSIAPDGSAGAYAVVQAEGTLRVLGLALEGSFSFAAIAGWLQVTATGHLEFETGDIRLLDLAFAGGFQISRNGMAAVLNLSVVSGSSSQDFAFDASAQCQLQVNTTGQEITGIGTLAVNLPAGRYARVSVQGTLRVLGLALSGSFQIETIGLYQVSIEAQIALELNVGGQRLFSFGGAGAMRLTGSGLAAKFTLELGANAASSYGFYLKASFALELNTTGAAISKIGTATVNLSAGRYVRVAANGLLTISGLRLAGVFGFTVSQDVVRVEAAANLDIWTGGVRVLALQVNGGLEISSTGIAALIDLSLRPSGGPSANLGFELSAAFKLLVNTTREQKTIAGVTLPDRPAGAMEPAAYGQVVATGELTVSRLKLAGRFAFTVSASLVRLEVDADVDLKVGSVTVLLLHGSGGMEISNRGLAAVVDLSLRKGGGPSGTLGFSISASFRLEVNTTQTQKIIAGVTLPDRPATTASPTAYARVKAQGTLNLFGLSLAGSFGFKVGASAVWIEVSADLDLAVASKPVLRLHGSAELEVSEHGLAGQLFLALRANGGPSLDFGFSVSGTFRLEVNTTRLTRSVNGVSLPDRPAGAVAPAAYAQVGLSGDLRVGGLTLRGAFKFTVSGSLVRIEADADLDLTLAGAPILLLEGSGGMELSEQGLAAVFNLSLRQNGGPSTKFGFTLEATFRLELNTTRTQKVIAAITLPDRPAGAAGPSAYLRVVASGSLSAGGFTLAGTFRFNLSGSLVKIEAEDIQLDLRVGGVQVLLLEGDGGLELSQQGLAAVIRMQSRANGGPAENLGLSINATFALELNTTKIPTTIAGTTLPDRPDGATGPTAYARVLATGSLSAGGFTLAGAFRFSLSGSLIRIEAEDIQLDLRVGDVQVFRLHGDGGLELSPQGLAAVIELNLGANGGPAASLGFTLNASFRLDINTTRTQKILAGITLPDRLSGQLVPTAYARLAVHGDLAVAGLTLTGDFQFTLSGSLVQVGADFDLNLAVAGVQVLRLEGTGGLEISRQGLAAAMDLQLRANGGPAVSLGFTLNVSFRLEINTTRTRKILGGATLPDRPVGAASATAYATVAAHGDLSLSGLTLSGDFQFTLAANLVQVQAEVDLDLRIGGIQVLLLEGSGGLEISSQGLAAVLNLSLRANGGPAASLGFSLAATFRFEANTTRQAKTIAGVNLSDRPRLAPQAAAYARIIADGELAVSGLTLSASLELVLADDLVRVHASRLQLDLKVGTYQIALLQGNGFLEISSRGLAAALDLRLRPFGAPSPALGFSLMASFRLEINTTKISKIMGNIILPNRPDGAVAPAAYARVFAQGTLTVYRLQLVGSFKFSVSAAAVQVDAIIGLEIEAGSTQVLLLHGAGGMQVSSNGIAAAIQMSLGVNGGPSAGLGFSLNATFRLEVNTTQSQQTIAGVTLPDRPAGANEPASYARVMAAGDLTVSGLSLGGTFYFTLAQNLVRIEAVADLDIQVGGVRVLALHGAGGLELSQAGLAAAVDLSLRAGGAPDASLGFTLNATFQLLINTTRTGKTIGNTWLPDRLSGAAPAAYAKVLASGTLGLSSFNLEGSFGLAVAANGIVQVYASAQLDLAGVGSLAATSTFEIYSAGIVAAIDLAGGGSMILSRGQGFTLTGRFRLEINTTASSHTLGQLRVNKSTGQILGGTDSVSIAARTVRVFLGGTLELTSLFKVHGKIQLQVGASGFSAAFDAGFSLMGTNLAVQGSGGIYTGANPGIALSITLKFGASATGTLRPGGFELAGGFKLELNTRTVRSDNVAPLTFQISVVNARLKMLGFELSGSLTIGVSEGLFHITVPASNPLRIRLFNFVNLSFSGYLRADGLFRVQASASTSLGTDWIGASASISVTFERAAQNALPTFACTLSGGAWVWEIDVGSISATISTAGRGSVTVEVLGLDVTLSINLADGGSISDGPVAGAFVFFDPNRNGVYDPDEPSTTSDQEGFFQLDFPLKFYDRNLNGQIDPDEGDVVCSGGIDLATGRPVVGIMRASAYGLNSGLAISVSPLSTLSASLMDRGLSIRQAEQKLNEGLGLGLPAKQPLLYLDPVQQTLLGRDLGRTALTTNVLLQNTVVQTGALLTGANLKLTPLAASREVYRQLADHLLSIPAGTTLDLTDDQTLTSILTDAGSSTSTVLSNELKQGAATIIGAGNTQLKQAAFTASAAGLKAAMQFQIASQTHAANALQQAAAGQANIQDIVASLSGQAYANLVSGTVAPKFAALVVNAAAEVDEGQTGPILPQYLTVKAADYEPSQLIYTLDQPPAHGQLRAGVSILQSGSQFTQKLINDGLLVYAHDGSETRSDTFQFTVAGADAATLVPLTVFRLTVLPMNDPPVAANDKLKVSEDSPLTLIPVLLNDSDPDGDTVELVAVAKPAHGIIEWIEGRLQYAPQPDYFGPDEFAYTIEDSAGLSDSASVSITVTPLQDAPVLISTNPLSGAIPGAGFVIPFDLLQSVTQTFDADGDSIAFRIEAIHNGSLTHQGAPVVPGSTVWLPAQSLLWSPPGDATGELAAFSFRAWDGQAASQTLLPVQIEFGPVDPPVLTLPTGILNYQENGQPVLLNATATLEPGGSTHFGGGQLTVEVLGGTDRGDSLAIRHQGTKPGQIGVGGETLLLGGVEIGAFTGGAGSAVPLVIRFSSTVATPEAVQALLRNLTYHNTSETPATTLRTVQFVLETADRVQSNLATRLVTVTALPDDPAIHWNAPADLVYGTALGKLQLNAVADVPGTYSYSPAGGTVLDAGSRQSLSLTFTPDDLVNYRTVTAGVAINVNPAPLLIAAKSVSKVYGAELPELRVAYSGFVNDDTPASLATPLTLTTAATSSSPVGTYPITATQAADANYTIRFVQGTLTVIPALLTIDVLDSVKTYGSPLPPLAAAYRGWVNNDTESSLETPLALTTEASADSPDGIYAITGAGATAANYVISINPGWLKVKPASTASLEQSSSTPWSRVTELALAFSDDVSNSLGLDDLALRHLDSGQEIQASQMALAYDRPDNLARLTFPALPGQKLADGNYRLTVNALGVKDADGLTLAADYSWDFHVLTGDANGDRVTNDLDLYRVWQSQLKPLGLQDLNDDLSGDHQVDGADLDLVRDNYLAALPTARPLSMGPSPVSFITQTIRPAIQPSRIEPAWYDHAQRFVWECATDFYQSNGLPAISRGSSAATPPEPEHQTYGLDPGRGRSDSLAPRRGADLFCARCSVVSLAGARSTTG